MHEYRITDGDLQKLIARALMKKLKAAGFHTGTPSDANAAFFFPINLQLTGNVEVTRYEDGTWVFTQCSMMIADRLSDTLQAHCEAIDAARGA